MAYKKRKARCGYCWQEGHNRTSCPKMKMEAAAGDSYAQRSLERSAVKQCSYCSGTDHNKATCERKFGDDRRDALCQWTGLTAAIEIVKRKKLGAGAFIYGPVMHRWNSAPRNNADGQPNNYDMVNYTIKEFTLTGNSAVSEFEGVYTFETLAEPSAGNYFKGTVPLPGLSREISNAPDSIGRTEWFRRNDARYDHDSRMILADNFDVLLEASEEEVNKAVAHLQSQKPMIVDYEDIKEYNSAKRKLAAQKKKDEAKENNSWQD